MFRKYVLTCMVFCLFLLSVVQVTADEQVTIDPSVEAETSTSDSDMTYETVPLYYFTDAVQVLKLLRSDASEVDAESYKTALTKAAESRKEAIRAELERQTAESDLASAKEDLAAANLDIAKANQSLRKAQDDSFRAQRLDDELAPKVRQVGDRLTEITEKMNSSDTSADDLKALEKERKELLAKQVEYAKQQAAVDEIKSSADARKAEAEATVGKSADSRGGAEARLATAETSFAEKLKLTQEKQTAAGIAVAERWYTEVDLSKRQRCWKASASAGSNDPIMKVDIQTLGASALLLHGKAQDIQKVRNAIQCLDRPVSQARASIWTIQVNGEGGKRGRRNMENVVAQIEKEMAAARSEVANTIALLQDCIVDEVYRVSASAYGTSTPKTRMAFFGEEVEEQLPDVVRCSTGNALDIQALVVDPLSVNSLGEQLMMVVLASGTSRKMVLDRFVDEAPGRICGSDKPRKIEFRELMTALGYHGRDGKEQKGLTPQQLLITQALNTTVNRETALTLISVLMDYELIWRDADSKAAAFQLDNKAELTKQNPAIVAQYGRLRARADTLSAQIGNVRERLASPPMNFKDLAPGAGNYTMKRIRDQISQDSLPRWAVGDQVIMGLMQAMERDLDREIIQYHLQRIRDIASAEGVELGCVQRTSILATDRRPAKVSPKSSIEFNLPEPGNLMTQTVSLAKLVAQAQLDAATGGLVEGLSAVSAATGIGKFSGTLDQLACQPGNDLPQIYKVESGAEFEFVPVELPDGQTVAFDLNYVQTTPVQEPENINGRRLGKIERHSISTRVQGTSYELSELSRFETQTGVHQPLRRSGGIPLLREIPVIKEIPVIGYFKSSGTKEVGLQESLIFVHTVVYPTLGDMLRTICP